VKGDRHKKIYLPSKPRTVVLTENTNLGYRPDFYVHAR
jgi:hypothetical protein